MCKNLLSVATEIHVAVLTLETSDRAFWMEAEVGVPNQKYSSLSGSTSNTFGETFGNFFLKESSGPCPMVSRRTCGTP